MAADRPGPADAGELVLSFVRDRFRASLRAPLDFESPLLTSGIIDSFGILELVAFLEDTFGISIDPARLDLTEFDSIGKIATFVSDHGGRR